MTEMKFRMKNNTTLMGTLLSLSFLCLTPAFNVSAIETTVLDHRQMMEMADVVVEGQVIGVTLVKRWVGKESWNRGSEMGEFEGWFMISKTLKGDYCVFRGSSDTHSDFIRTAIPI